MTDEEKAGDAVRVALGGMGDWGNYSETEQQRFIRAARAARALPAPTETLWSEQHRAKPEAADLRRYGVLVADPTRTDLEDAWMRGFRASLLASGNDPGWEPCPRDVTTADERQRLINQAGPWFVLRKRETDGPELWRFDEHAEAADFFDRAQAQWSDTYLLHVLRGPGDVLAAHAARAETASAPKPVERSYHTDRKCGSCDGPLETSRDAVCEKCAPESTAHATAESMAPSAIPTSQNAERLRVLLFESDSVAWQNAEGLQEAQDLFARITAESARVWGALDNPGMKALDVDPAELVKALKGSHAQQLRRAETLATELDVVKEEARCLGRTLKAVESALGPGAGPAPARVAGLVDAARQDASVREVRQKLRLEEVHNAALALAAKEVDAAAADWDRKASDTQPGNVLRGAATLIRQMMKAVPAGTFGLRDSVLEEVIGQVLEPRIRGLRCVIEFYGRNPSIAADRTAKATIRAELLESLLLTLRSMQKVKPQDRAELFTCPICRDAGHPCIFPCSEWPSLPDGARACPFAGHAVMLVSGKALDDVAALTGTRRFPAEPPVVVHPELLQHIKAHPLRLRVPGWRFTDGTEVGVGEDGTLLLPPEAEWPSFFDRMERTEAGLVGVKGQLHVMLKPAGADEEPVGEFAELRQTLTHVFTRAERFAQQERVPEARELRVWAKRLRSALQAVNRLADPSYLARVQETPLEPTLPEAPTEGVE